MVAVRHNRRAGQDPGYLPRFVPLPSTDGPTFAFLEDVIRQNLDLLFPNVEVLNAHLFRVIRDATSKPRKMAKAICSSRSIRA